MSLSWPDRRLAILPGRVALAMGRAVTELPVPDGQAGGLLQTLGEAIDRAGCKGRVEVVLSHALAPVWLLPAPGLRLDWQETRGWVREQMNAHLGERAGQCRLAFDPAPPGEPLLVSAVDEQWLSDLLATLAGKGVRVRHLQPWLAAAVNRGRARLRRGAHWLALAEPGRLTLAHFSAGRLDVVRSLQVNGDMATALDGAVRRESLLAGLPDEAPVWLEACVEVGEGQAGAIDLRPLGAPGVGRLVGA